MARPRLPRPPKQPHGGARIGSGAPKGFQWPSTLSKHQIREESRGYIQKHLPAIWEAQIAAAIGTWKLMLRSEDGTWRAASVDDNLEAALNGDPNMFRMTQNQPSTAAAVLLTAYCLDKPKEQEQEIVVTNVDAKVQRLMAARKRLGEMPAAELLGEGDAK